MLVTLQSAKYNSSHYGAIIYVRPSCRRILVNDASLSLLELLNLILRVRDLHHIELRMLVIVFNDTDPADALQQAGKWRHNQQNAPLQPLWNGFGGGKAGNTP